MGYDVHCGRPEQSAARGRYQQANDHAVLVADLGDGVAGRCGNNKIEHRADKIGAKKSKLHQHRLEIGQYESLLETRNQDVVEHRHEPPHEKQGSHDGE